MVNVKMTTFGELITGGPPASNEIERWVRNHAAFYNLIPTTLALEIEGGPTLTFQDSLAVLVEALFVDVAINLFEGRTCASRKDAREGRVDFNVREGQVFIAHGGVEYGPHAVKDLAESLSGGAKTAVAFLYSCYSYYGDISERPIQELAEVCRKLEPYIQ